MTVLDIVLLVVMAFFSIKGYQDGFILSVINVILLIASLFIAVLYVAEFSNFLSTYIYLLSESAIEVIAFIILFLLLFFVLSFFAKVLKIVNKIPLVGLLNKVLGSLFGLIKGVLILSILAFLFNMYRTRGLFENKTKESQVYNYLIDIAPSTYNTVVSLIPIGQGFYDEFNKEVKKKIDKRLQETLKDSS